MKAIIHQRKFIEDVEEMKLVDEANVPMTHEFDSSGTTHMLGQVTSFANEILKVHLKLGENVSNGRGLKASNFL